MRFSVQSHSSSDCIQVFLPEEELSSVFSGHFATRQKVLSEDKLLAINRKYTRTIFDIRAQIS